MPVNPFDLHLGTRVVFGEGSLASLGSLARDLGFRRALLVADAGLVATGQVDRAVALLEREAVAVVRFHEFEPNPDSHMVEAGRVRASAAGVDSIVAIGGGSALDCAKGINFVLTNGGTMADYRGHGRATRPMLPSLGIPTTAGTGSEAQSFAIISDPVTHAKMACGDPGAAFRVAILDPLLTISQPPTLTAVTGIDAISHAVEAFVTVRRTWASDLFAGGAWRRLSASFPRVIVEPDDIEARAGMLFGAHLAGTAVEQSMLGATHACANPLTARYGTTHGVAIGVLLPHVVRWNAGVVADRYAELLAFAGDSTPGAPGERLADRLASYVAAAGLPSTLEDVGASRADVQALARDAATQWTGTFNPRPFNEKAAMELYERAFR